MYKNRNYLKQKKKFLVSKTTPAKGCTYSTHILLYVPI
jgi:hypothetical protein